MIIFRGKRLTRILIIGILVCIFAIFLVPTVIMNFINNEQNLTFEIKIYNAKDLYNLISNETYSVDKYEEQFLDELSNKGVVVHYSSGAKEEYEKSNKYLKELGVNYARVSFLHWDVKQDDGTLDYSVYDNWVNDIENSTDINLIVDLGSSYSIYGNDLLINSDEEIEKYVDFFLKTKEHYPFIKDYEIMNELNLYAPSYKGAYLNEEDMKWYSKLIKRLNEVSGDTNIITNGTSTPNQDTTTSIKSEKFYTYFNNTKGTYYTNNFAYHPYVMYNMTDFREKINSHNNLFNSFGGFNNKYITEYGLTVLLGSEKNQADDLVKQTIALDETSDIIILYNLWTTTNDQNSYEQFGLLTNDYKPRPAYYVMQNYYEKTNGAEYIGQVNIAEGIEAHIYDKDGKPRMILWTENRQDNIDIPYSGFTATDMYGNIIENTDGKLNINSSPIYLDDISNMYFYEAISNTALEKYAEFKEKFATELSNIDGIDTEINKLKEYMASISDNETETQKTATEKMSEHFALGNTVLDAYKNGKLDIEYERLSSMLDILNDIGDSYEDLLTVSATTREPYFTATQELINSAETIIADNSNLEIVYPSKILDFSKDLHQKAEYINSLDEENDIKTGLIVSYSLHSYYLADWANEFAKIYVGEEVPQEYTIKDGYILNVKKETTNANFAEKFGISTEYSITRNNENVDKNSILATGDVLQLENGEKYTIIVAGDINGDGKVANYDLSALRRYILRIRDFNELESLAADINVDGQALGVKDYSRMKIELLNTR